MGKKNLKYQSPGINEGTRFEKLHTVTFDNSEIASNLIAREICDLVKLKQDKGKNCVLGFATGSSPTLIYKEIIRIHKDCLLYTSPSPRDGLLSRMPSSA